MKLVDLQTMMNGDQKLYISKHDGYCMSVNEITYVKDLDKSPNKDAEVQLISGGTQNEIWINL